MRVSTLTSGLSTLVASRAPPIPVSTTATSTRSAAKCRKASAVAASKKVRPGSIPSASSSPSTTASAGISRPSTWMRSLNRQRCGEV